jgi:hypothetical protein
VWVNPTIKSHFPDSASLEVTDVILKNSALPESQRFILIQQLLSANNTDHLARVLTDLVWHWTQLTASEITLILDLLTSARPDQDWLHAALVISSSLNPELLAIIFDGALQSGINEATILELPVEQLRKSLQILIQRPAECLHFVQLTDIWRNVLVTVSQNSAHPLFLLCLEGLLLREMNSFAIDAIIAGSTEHAEAIFSLMLGEIRMLSDDHVAELWEALLDRAHDDAMLQKWLRRIMTQSLSSSLFQFLHCMPVKYHSALLEQLPDDLMLLNMVGKVKKVMNEGDDFGLIETIITGIMALFKTHPPRHFTTCDVLVAFFKTLSGNQYAIEVIQMRRAELFKTKHHTARDFERFLYPGWVN